MRRSFIPPLLLSLSAMAPQAPTTPPQGLAPNDLVRKVVTHELQADDQDHTHWMYREVTNLPPPSKTKTVIETTDGDLTYLDEIDGRPLTPDQKREEDQRVQSLSPILPSSVKLGGPPRRTTEKPHSSSPCCRMLSSSSLPSLKPGPEPTMSN
jgi:hypothetical protein